LSLAKPEFEEDQRKLLEKYPCILLKSALNHGRPGITEIIFTEKLVSELEYRLDEFASTILENGIPQ